MKEAHEFGGFAWDAAKRRDYANGLSDPNTLIAVDLGRHILIEYNFKSIKTESRVEAERWRLCTNMRFVIKGIRWQLKR